jgi:transposase-like protein
MLHLIRLQLQNLHIRPCIKIVTGFSDTLRKSLPESVRDTSFRRITDSIILDSSLFKGEIELDEMYYRSGLKGSSYSAEIKALGRNPRRRGLKRHKRGRGTYEEDLCPLLSIVNRGGNFLLLPINTAGEDDIKEEVYKYCDMGSSIFYTDEWRSYNFLDNREYVTHSNHEYCRDGQNPKNRAKTS